MGMRVPLILLCLLHWNSASQQDLGVQRGTSVKSLIKVFENGANLEDRRTATRVQRSGGNSVQQIAQNYQHPGNRSGPTGGQQQMIAARYNNAKPASHFVNFQKTGTHQMAHNVAVQKGHDKNEKVMGIGEERNAKMQEIGQLDEAIRTRKRELEVLENGTREKKQMGNGGPNGVAEKERALRDLERAIAERALETGKLEGKAAELGKVVRDREGQLHSVAKRLAEKVAQLEGMGPKMEEAGGKLDKGERELAQLDRSLAEKRAELQRVGSEMDGKGVQNADLETQKRALELALAKLGRELGEAQDGLKALRAESAKVGGETRMAEERLARLREEAAELQGELAEKRAQLGATERALEERNAQKGEVKKEGLGAEKEKMAEEVAKLNGERSEMEKKLKALREAAEHEKKRMDGERVKVEGESQTAKEGVNKLRKEMGELEQKIGGKRKELAEIESGLGEKKAEKAENEKSAVKTAQSEAMRREKERERLSADLAKLEEGVRGKKAEYGELEKSLNGLRDLAEREKVANRQLEEESRKALEQLRGEVDAAKRAKEALTKQMDEQRDALDRLAADVEKARKGAVEEQQKAEEGHKTRRLALEKELGELEARAARGKDRIGELERKLAERQKELEAKEIAHKKWEEEKTRMEGEKQKLARELAEQRRLGSEQRAKKDADGKAAEQRKWEEGQEKRRTDKEELEKELAVLAKERGEREKAKEVSKKEEQAKKDEGTAVAEYPKMAASIRFGRDVKRLNPCDDFYKFVCDGYHKDMRESEKHDANGMQSALFDELHSKLYDLLTDPAMIAKYAHRKNFDQMYLFHNYCLTNQAKPKDHIELVKRMVRREKWPQIVVLNEEWIKKVFPFVPFFNVAERPVTMSNAFGTKTAQRTMLGVNTKRMGEHQMVEVDQEKASFDKFPAMTNLGSQVMRDFYDEGIFGGSRKSSEQRIEDVMTLENSLVHHFSAQGSRSIAPISIKQIGETLSNGVFAFDWTQFLKREHNYVESEAKVPSTSRRFKRGATSKGGRNLVDLLKGGNSRSPNGMGGPMSMDDLFEGGNSPFSLGPTDPGDMDLGSLLQQLSNGRGPLQIPNPTGTRQRGNDDWIHTSEQELARLNGLLSQFDSETLSDYIKWYYLWQFLPKVSDMALMENKRKLSCVKHYVRPYFKHLLDYVYVKERISEETLREGEKVVDAVKAGFRQMLVNNHWMDEKTRGLALEKVDAMHNVVGYFRNILDDEKELDALYGGLKLSPGMDWLTVFFALRKNVAKWPSQQLYIESYEVNAFYTPQANTIAVVSSNFQMPSFDASFPSAFNFGALGATVGHEITHGFDSKGKNFDKDGLQVDWWEPTTAQKYEARKQCFERQYARVPGNGEAARKTNKYRKRTGGTTIGEDIADNGGVKAAFAGWELSQRQSGAAQGKGTPAKAIKGLEQYSHRQLFFLAYAFNWCRMKRTNLSEQEEKDVHSSSQLRVNLPLSNFAEFADAFQCQRGTRMAPQEQQRCTLW